MLNEDVSESLAYGIVEIRSKIIAYYQDEEHERAFQEMAYATLQTLCAAYFVPFNR